MRQVDNLAYNGHNDQYAGILFQASATAPDGNIGSFRWVQLVDTDSGDLQVGSARESCTGGPSTPELDLSYPYATQLTSLTATIPLDVATDAPGFAMQDTTDAEGARQFSATMYLMWIPDAAGGCNDPSCTIPILLGYLSLAGPSAGWQSNGDAINSLVPQATGYHGTSSTFIMGYGPQLPTPTFTNSLSVPLAVFPQWGATYYGPLTCQ